MALVQTLLDFMRNVPATIIGIVAVYVIFKPYIRLGDRVQTSVVNGGPACKYNCLYRNSYLRLQDVHVRVWMRIRIEDGDTSRYILLTVPVDDAELPLLRHSWKKKGQLPRLLLEEVSWAQLPNDDQPDRPYDLAEILGRLDARLHLHVTATTSVFGVTRVHHRSYGANEVEAAEVT